MNRLYFVKYIYGNNKYKGKSYLVTNPMQSNATC